MANGSARAIKQLSDKIVHYFKTLDTNEDGHITQLELMALFRSIKGFQKFTDSDYSQLFARADWNSDGRLAYEEFVDWILGLEIPQLYSREGVKKRYSVYRTREIMYQSGVTINIAEVEKDIEVYTQQLHTEGFKVAAKFREFINSKSYNKTLHGFFLDADASGNGVLSWNDKEVFNFCMLCFERMGLPRTGGDRIFHGLYHKFDIDNTNTLSERECMCMMDSIIRAIARSQRVTDPAESSASDSD
mmetsp:Transcript_96155/g.206306  ORF Transcript_96155/g.206306 Transcript_96155/m.206306 type:complete len:246 (-) Transcript_96155:88-825(-)